MDRDKEAQQMAETATPGTSKVRVTLPLGTLALHRRHIRELRRQVEVMSERLTRWLQLNRLGYECGAHPSTWSWEGLQGSWHWQTVAGYAQAGCDHAQKAIRELTATLAEMRRRSEAAPAGHPKQTDAEYQAWARENRKRHHVEIAEREARKAEAAPQVEIDLPALEDVEMTHLGIEGH